MAANEDTAFIELGRRRSRLHVLILTPFVIVGVLSGVPGYMLAREIQFAIWQVSWVLLSGLVGFVVPAVVFSAIGQAIARRMVRVRTRAWIGELAERHGVARDKLEQIAGMIEHF